MQFPPERYSIAYVEALAQELGGSVATTLTQSAIEHRRTGGNAVYATPESGVIRVSMIVFD